MKRVEIKLMSLIGIIMAIILILIGLTKVDAKTTDEIKEVAVAEPVVEELEPQTVAIEDVEISKDMDLTVTTGLSREDFIKLISELKYDTSNFFEENAETIYDLCQEYNINEIFFCGLIAEESGWDIASNHRRTNNYISLMSNGKLISYGSVYEGLQIAAQKLHDNYFTEGSRFYNGTTLAGLKVRFCPSSTTWINAVYGRMQAILE